MRGEERRLEEHDEKMRRALGDNEEMMGKGWGEDESGRRYCR